ncbi:MAG: co-chaperone DjlA [Steroidobacteraceae bacterium]
MGWQGKVIGMLLGALVGRGLLGAIVGFVLGHFYDLSAARDRASRVDPATLRNAFFRATFQVMGHVAKADGRVSEQEIEAARAVMRHYRLGPEEVQLAIELFTDGKRADFPLDQALAGLRAATGGRDDLARLFVQIQLEASMLGAGLNPASRGVFQRVCSTLGVTPREFAAIEAMLRMHHARRDGGGEARGAAGGRGAPDASRLDDAYAVLGVAREASDREVKLAYRRLMSQNHPDKLVANGLPPSMIEAAHERTRRIIEAYELVRESRGMK